MDGVRQPDDDVKTQIEGSNNGAKMKRKKKNELILNIL